MSRASRSDDELLKFVGGRIRTAREREGLTQERLAEALGIGSDTLSRYETAAIPVSITRLQRIAEVLNTDIAEFLRVEPTIGADDIQELLDLWRTLNRGRRQVLLQFLREFVVR